jgi:hypothetical protein
MNTKILMTTIAIAAALALLTVMTVETMFVSQQTFGIRTSTFHGCGHDTTPFEASQGKCHHHND